MSDFHSSQSGSREANAVREQNDRIILALLLTGATCVGAYMLASRFHIYPHQIVEFVLYLMAFLAAGSGCWWYLKNRKTRTEDAPIRTAAFISMRRDQKELAQAHRRNAVVLGHRRNGRAHEWPDSMRMRHALLTGQPGCGKTTAMKNIADQDIRRWVNVLGRFHRLPLVIVDGKGDKGFLWFVVEAVAAAGRLDDLRILDPLDPEISERFNPLYVGDGRYHDALNNLFASFLLTPDFFRAHQASYFNDVGRVLHYAGKTFNIRDVMVTLLDESVLREQIAIAKILIERRAGISIEERENLRTSVANLQQSFRDRERVAKIQGLINELNTFLEDDLSVVTGAYEDLLTFKEIFEQQRVLYVSLNTNKNSRTMTAIGRMLLQQLQLEIGRRFELDPEELGGLPMANVMLDEFAQFAYPHFAQTLQTARGANVAFLLSMQSIAQLRTVSESFQIDICSAPSTLMLMRTFDDATTRFFRNASSQIRRPKRVEMLEDVGFLQERYMKSGRGSTTDVLEFRAEDYVLKNLPTGQMEVLMSDDESEAQYFNLQVRRAREYDLGGLEMPIYPKLRRLIARTNGANLRFKSDDLGRRHGRIFGR
jgi:hypothetical protein